MPAMPTLSSVEMPSVTVNAIKSAVSMPTMISSTTARVIMHPKAAILNRAASMHSYLTKSLSSKSPWRLKERGEAGTAVENQPVVLQMPRTPQPSELIVIAIMHVTYGTNNKKNESTASRFSRWPRSLGCTVRYGDAMKSSDAMGTSSKSKHIFNEKFIFLRSDQQEGDAKYGDLHVEITSTSIGTRLTKEKIGDVVIPLDQEFARHPEGQPIRKSSNATCVCPPARSASAATRGFLPFSKKPKNESAPDQNLTVHYVLHRIPIDSKTAESASRALSRSSRSLDDEDDMEIYGHIFPELWYLIPDEPTD